MSEEYTDQAIYNLSVHFGHVTMHCPAIGLGCTMEHIYNSLTSKPATCLKYTALNILTLTSLHCTPYTRMPLLCLQ